MRQLVHALRVHDRAAPCHLRCEPRGHEAAPQEVHAEVAAEAGDVELPGDRQGIGTQHRAHYLHELGVSVEAMTSERYELLRGLSLRWS